MSSRGFGVRQAQDDERWSEEIELNTNRPGEIAVLCDGAREIEPEATRHPQEISRCGCRSLWFAPDLCGNGVSGNRLSRHSRLLASRCTTVDSGLQR